MNYSLPNKGYHEQYKQKPQSMTTLRTCCIFTYLQDLILKRTNIWTNQLENIGKSLYLWITLAQQQRNAKGLIFSITPAILSIPNWYMYDVILMLQSKWRKTPMILQATQEVYLHKKTVYQELPQSLSQEITRNNYMLCKASFLPSMSVNSKPSS